MSGVKSKKADSSGDRASAEADLQPENPDIQVKEEPPDMDEYLKSSEAYVQSHAKSMPVVAPLAKSTPSVKTTAAQATKPVSGPSVTSKPVIVVRRPITGQQGPKNVLSTTAAAVMTSGQRMLKTVSPAVTLVGRTSDKSETLLPSTVGGNRGPLHIQTNVAPSVAKKLASGPETLTENRLSGAVAKTASSLTTKVVTVDLNRNAASNICSVANSSSGKNIVKGLGVKQTLIEAKSSNPKVSAPSLGVKSVANNTVASSVIKEPLVSKAASKSQSMANVGMASQKPCDSSRPVQKAPMGSKPLADDKTTKGPILRRATNIVRGAVDVARPVPIPLTSSAAGTDISSDQSRCIQDRSCAVRDEATTDTNFAEVVIKSEPIDDYPENTATSLRSSLPEACMDSLLSAVPLSSLPQANSSDYITGVSVISSSELPSLSQNSLSTDVVRTEAESSIEVSPMVAEYCITDTVEPSSSGRLLTSLDESFVSVATDTGDGANEVSSGSACNLVVSTDCSDVDLSIVKTEPLEEDHFVELSAAITSTILNDECSDSTVASNAVLNIHSEKVFMVDDLNLSQTQRALNETISDSISHFTHIITQTIPEVRGSADINTVFSIADARTDSPPEVTGNVVSSVELTKHVSTCNDEVDAEQNLSVLPMDLDVSDEQLTPDSVHQMSVLFDDPMTEITNSANEESAFAYDIAIGPSLQNISSPSKVFTGFSEASETHPLGNRTDARPVFGVLSPQTVLNRSPRSDVTQEKQIAVGLVKPLCGRKSDKVEQNYGTNKAGDVGKDKETSCPARMADHDESFVAKSSMKNNGNLSFEKSNTFPKHSDFENQEMLTDKHMMRRKRAQDNGFDRSLDSDAKHRRSSNPRFGKENASGAMKFYTNVKKDLSHNVTRQVLAANLMPNQESDDHLEKRLMESISEYLSLETSSFLDDDLGSGCYSPEPHNAYKLRKVKQNVFNIEDKRRNWLRHKRTAFKRSSDYRQSMKKPNLDILNYNVFPFLSEFSKHSLSDCSWYMTSCEVEDIVAGHRQDLISDLNSVYIGKQPRFFLPPMDHLGNLSLETQLESQIIESVGVKSIYLAVAKEWVRKKPLHQFVNGQLKIEKKTYLPPKRTSRINVVSENCQRVFSHDICRMLADICELGESEDSLFSLPDGLSQFTTNRVFRKVKQYLRNYVKRLRRNWGLAKEPHYESKNFREDSFFSKTRTKPRDHSVVSDYAVDLSLPSPDTVIRMQETKLVSSHEHLRSLQQNSVATRMTSLQQESEEQESENSSEMECETSYQNEVTTSLLTPVTSQPVTGTKKGSSAVASHDNFDRFLSVNTRRLSVEASEPVRTSVSSAYDSFCKEAEDICEQVGKSKDAVSFNTRSADTPDDVIDSSKLYSPTRPTDMEEQELLVTSNVAAINKKSLPSDTSTLEVRNHDSAFAGANKIERGSGRESKLATNESSGARKTDGDKVVVPNTDVQMVDKLTLPKVTEKEHSDESEVEIHITLEESFTESEAEIPKQRTVCSQVTAVKQKDVIMKKVDDDSIKRKKRKSMKEKKAKKRKDKYKSEVCESSEKDRPKKKRKYRHTSEENKENAPAMFHEDPNNSSLLQVCRASASDAVYTDSYTSVVEDVINPVPASNFDDYFDPLLPPGGHYRNPFRLSWSLLEWFITKDTDALSKSVGIIPDVKRFNAQILKPHTSFLWSLVLAVFDVVRQEPAEPENGKKGDDHVGEHNNLKPNTEEMVDISNVGDDGVKKASVKGSNPLMQAFRQVVEAKRRLSKDSQKPKSVSAISKLSAELAARRAAPKSAKPLYKPSGKHELPVAGLQQQQSSGSVDINPQINDDQSAQLVKEALVDFYEEVKKLLDGHDDIDIMDGTMYDSSCAHISDGNLHLDAVSSLVFSLYENYEEYCKQLYDQNENNELNGQLQEETTIIIDDGNVEYGDNVITLSSDGINQSSKGNLEERVRDALEADANQVADESEGIALSTESGIEAAIAPLDEKQISISKNIEGGVEVLAKTALGLDDRQYISSFPPIGPSKKKPKVHSQVPRMVFAKLIGPALERLGTMAVGNSGSAVPSEILAANSSTNTLNAVVEAATSSASSSAADAFSAVSRATDVRKPAEASSVVESLVVSHAVVSTSVVENIALPSITVSTGSNLSSSKTITRSTSTASSTSTSQLLISVASVSSSLPIPSSSAFITGPSLVSSASATQTSVSSSATIKVTASENSGLPSSEVVKSTEKTLPSQPPLPTADSNIVPPPMPPLAFSQIENSAASSSTADSSSYYQNSYPGLSTSQSQDYMSGYYGYVGQPLDPNLVTSWMYDPSMQYAASAQAQFVDPNMMSYPPPMTSEQVPFYLPPTNQPPPFLPPPATGPLFPAYSSNQPAGPFSVPPPNMLPITVPPPSIPPAVLPPIMDPSVPPPSIFPSASPLQTSVPPPVCNSFGIPWSHESSDPNNSVPFVPSSSSQPTTASSLSTQSVNAPQYALEQQQQNDPLHSVHEIIKYPPPPLPGGLQVSTSAVTSSQVQQNPSTSTASSQFSNQSGNSLQNPLQSNQESFATKSLNSGAGEHVNSSSSQGLHLGNGNDESQNQVNSSKANALPSNQVPPEEVMSKNDYDSRKQPWYFDSKQQANVPRPQQRSMGLPSQNEQMSNQESGWPKEMQEQPPFGRGSLQPDSFESNNSMRQHGLDGPEQRPPGPRIIPPNVQPRQPTPRQMLKNPQTRQPGSEPRQFGLQQRPSGSEVSDSSPRTGMPDSGPRHPGQHIRPSDPKQMGSGLQFRQAGPESRHFGQPEERHPGPVPRHNADALRRPSDSSAPGSSVQTKQLNPQMGSAEQGEKMHNLMPRDFNAQMRPELKQAGQWPRQPGVEPRQSGPPQRLAGPPHRPPLMPDQRQVRPGMPPRHPGPGDDPETSLQRISHMKPGHSPHGNIRPSMESKAPEQMQGSQQPRAPFNPSPQMLSDLKKNRPVAPGLDRRQSDSIPRFSGPPAEGPRGNSGPRGVAPLLDFKSRIHEDPKVKPLMDISLRKPAAGTDSASGSERSSGHLPSQGGISNMRFYVFNVDRPVCRAAEQILLHAGARKFDPHNINALRAMPEIRCLLLVHKEDLRIVQKIPSLLRLKRDLRVTFATFTDPVDIQQRRFITFFPRAGTMVMDLTALLACKSDVLDGICQFMTTQTEEKRTSWKLMLPSNVFNAIDFLKYKYEDDPEEHVRLAELSQAITAHKASGIVELLPEHPYRGQPRTTVEYHNCCVALQISRLALFRHFLFVTDMPRNHPDAHLFLSNGIDVLNVPEFMRCFVSCDVEHQPKLHPPYITRVTVNRFVDAAISNAAECLSV